LAIHKTRAVFLLPFIFLRGFYSNLAARQGAAGGMEGQGGNAAIAARVSGERPTADL